jgi:hypothetical protein
MVLNFFPLLNNGTTLYRLIHFVFLTFYLYFATHSNATNKMYNKVTNVSRNGEKVAHRYQPLKDALNFCSLPKEVPGPIPV